MRKLTLFGLSLAVGATAFADTYKYFQTGHWEDPGNWWNATQGQVATQIPGASDTAKFNNPDSWKTATLTTSTEIYALETAWEARGVGFVIDGGTLTVNRSDAAAVLGYNRESSHVVKNNGTFNLADSLIVGRNDAKDEQTVSLTVESGGVVDVANELVLGYNFDASHASGARVDINHGGTINTNSLAIDNDNNQAGNGFTVVNLAGGTLVVDGDITSSVATWNQDGRMAAFDGQSHLVYDYDVTNAGKTTISAYDLAACKVTQTTPVSGATVYDDHATLTWTRPTVPAGGVLVGYEVYFGTSADVTTNTMTAVTSESISLSLAEGTDYFWRIDALVDAGGHSYVVQGDFSRLYTYSPISLDPAPTWYVGETEAGEWIEHKQVYLSAGDYRFTAHLGSAHDGQTVNLSVGGNSLGSVTVPNTDGLENFDLVHLGRTTLTAGLYDVRLVFETGNVSSDFVYIRKSSSTSSVVVADDIASPAPGGSDGCAITPVLTLSNVFDKFNGEGGYSDEQNLAWYKQPAYAFNLAEDMGYISLEELISARVDWVWLHGRSAQYNDETQDILVDRDYVAPNGNLPGQLHAAGIEKVDAHPFADYLKFAYFVDNAAFGGRFESANPGQDAAWGSTAFQDYIWDEWLRAWFATVPEERIYKVDGNRALIDFWTTDCGVTNDGMLYEFLEAMDTKCQAEFGFGLAIVGGGVSLINVDPRVADIQYAGRPWFYWGENTTNVTFSPEVNGKVNAFATNGRRLPLVTIWENDWDPETNTGTRKNASQYNDEGYYLPTHDSEGYADFETGLVEADERGCEWMFLEAWNNWKEGTTWYRSYHEDYAYPNEFITISRQYADKDTPAILLPAEGADAFNDTTTGNTGQSFAYDWYGDTDIDLDIYRPMRALSAFTQFETPAEEVVELVAGHYDIWVLNSEGRSWATEKDGNHWWSNTYFANQTRYWDHIAMGKDSIWMQSGTSLYRAGLPSGWPCSNASGEVEVATGFDFQTLATNINRLQVWGVDSSNRVWVSDQDTVSFTEVTGAALTDLAAGESFIWGITTAGDLVQRRADLSGDWLTVSNDYAMVELVSGSDELWGRTANGDLYRMSEHGSIGWQYVASDVRTFGVSPQYVWLIKNDNTAHWARLFGFSERTTSNLKVYIEQSSSGAGRLNRLASDVDMASSGATGVDVEWKLLEARSGYYYIQHGDTGLRLNAVDANSVNLVAAGTTGDAVEWAITDYDETWSFITNRAQGRKLHASSGGSFVPDLTEAQWTGENTRWRVVLPSFAPVRVELTNDDFESGWGNWIDGGSDARLSTSNAVGSQCFALQDNTGSSVATLSSSIDVSSLSELQIEFSFVAESFENAEDFWVQFSSDGGSTWTTVKAYVHDVDFADDGTRYSETITLDSGSYTFNNNVKIRFRCDASGNGDDVYIDNVVISGL